MPAAPGLFQLRDDLQRAVAARLAALGPPGRATPLAAAPTHFMLTVEISTIYKKGERTRKVHHVICVPSLAAADRIGR